MGYHFDPWTAMFVIGGLGYIIPAIIFCAFGSASVQKWNDIITLTGSQNKKSSKVNSIHLITTTGNVPIDDEQSKL